MDHKIIIQFHYSELLMEPSKLETKLSSKQIGWKSILTHRWDGKLAQNRLIMLLTVIYTICSHISWSLEFVSHSWETLVAGDLTYKSHIVVLYQFEHIFPGYVDKHQILVHKQLMQIFIKIVFPFVWIRPGWKVWKKFHWRANNWWSFQSNWYWRSGGHRKEASG